MCYFFKRKGTFHEVFFLLTRSPISLFFLCLIRRIVCCILAILTHSSMSVVCD